MLLQVFDVLSTMVGFAMGLGEANPFLRNLIPTLGPLMALVIGKLLASTILLVVGLYVGFRGRNVNWKFLNIAFAGVVLWNLGILAIRTLIILL